MDKTAIRNFAIEARKILMKSAITEAGFYGITKDGCKDPVQKGNDFEVYETVAGTENRIFGDDIKRRANLVQAIKTLGFEQVIEETAYTWFNRIIAIRFMEVNNYLPTRVRVLSSETGSGTPDIITQADTVELNLTSDELEKIQTAKRENHYDDAFRMLFIKQCNELNAILPGLFEKTDDYMELLLKITYTGDGVIRMLVDSIPEDNFNVETEGQVEIIGWMYQYYNTELKDDTFAKLKDNVKITKERIPAATQLFTPDWIVRYMVENSLGRVWMEHLRANNPDLDEKAKAEEFGWRHYLPEASQEKDIEEQLVEVRKSYGDLAPQDITCIDPCMGSGHILVYMFDVLMDIYRSEGFSEREAVFDILEKNIRGLDIDRRAYQLSYFALMMKARGYNRIFFRGHDDIDGNRVQAVPRVYAIEESNSVDRELLKYYGAGLDELSKNNAINQINGLLDELHDAKEFGSILNIENYEWELLRTFLANIEEEYQGSLFGYMALNSRPILEKLIDVGEVLAKKYDAVVTNPPYMGSKSINPKLLTYIQDKYARGKADIYGAFIEKCIRDFAKNNGFIGLLTPYVWLYLSSFADFRKNLISQSHILSLVQLEYNAFEVACVPVCTFAMRKHSSNYKGRYVQLAQFRGWDNQEPHVLDAIKDFSLDYCFETEQTKFELVPDSPIAYWISDNMYRAFEKADRITSIGMPRQGMATADNGRFMRIWYEVSTDDIDFHCESSSNTEKKWYPHSKGGSLRRWYGNNIFVINWKNNGSEIRAFKKAVVRNPDYYFKKGISWSDLTISWFTARWVPNGFTFDSSGPTFFANDENLLNYVCGYFNSWVFQEFLNISCQGMHYSNGVIANLPIIIGNESQVKRINELVSRNIDIAKADWDSVETSWDFNKLYITTNINGATIEDKVSEYIAYHEEMKRELAENEKEIDAIFAEIFGMTDEKPSKGICPSTLREIDSKSCVLELISYAVGCMFGRYSISEGGLAYAGGKFEVDKYKTFEADNDAIIPITDEQYFNDDIVGRFIEFIGTVYGKQKLKINLEYITQVLGTKGSTSREKLRNYFINDYYKDHCNLYSVSGSGKRPIYWLFDSGKQNGFKCLIYLHRYTQDTVGMIRSDYLTKTQSMIENALKNSEYAMNSASSAVDRAQATKRRDKYIKQLAEIRAYYPALSHIALQKIELDLDDGVKTNYEKFQGIEVSIEGEKKQKVDLLAKI